ncbi:Trifunctional NAD biosynthesis/regulator protein NadR [Mycobacterium basiliense]|uniref:Trifunctional NAD biosynthesis/regulator protein NadR n=1 Tax=Mycobacterium basiliense TaxID=2094119 RepID=A0A3S4BEF2_9MYCO|nr:nicotinamide-nucleotide adenylyltransferase [Mycobacterium basiliense]VDM86519.1 Trifunctional NAD biosynthesis/regulator protein NadR [Mycobacterium basiliense]
MTHGMVLGRFLPPHAGHVYLCEFARRWVDDLTIVISVQNGDPISGTQRFAWMRELFPFDRVVHLAVRKPQDPCEQPPSWDVWKARLERVLPKRPEFVFASEPYGVDLANILGARFVAVDQARAIVPVSGTSIRADPLAHWQHIPRCVRPAFVKRVSIIGPEFTGKTTLARVVAETLETTWVPEWTRTLRDRNGGSLVGLDWTEIVRGQIASEEALARNADRVLICDTDPLVATVWAEFLRGSCPEQLRELARRPYDLTLLTRPDAPCSGNGVRCLPGQSDEFFAACEHALRAAGRPFVVVGGGWEERTSAALRAVEKLAPSQRS